MVGFTVQNCTGCGKEFRTRNDSAKCYKCTLAEICGVMPPEEGDFNTAMIRSGEYTDLDLASLQADLAAVEEGRSTESLGYVEDPDEGEYDDPAWCYNCNRDVAFCECNV